MRGVIYSLRRLSGKKIIVCIRTKKGKTGCYGADEKQLLGRGGLTVGETVSVVNNGDVIVNRNGDVITLRKFCENIKPDSLKIVGGTDID